MNESIGNRITRFRKAKGLTQEGLAAVMGISSQAVSKWENDLSCPDVSLLPKLCRTLGITCDELLTGSSNEVQLLPENQRKPLEELVLHVNILSSSGEKVQVNLPIPLVQMCLKMGIHFIPSGVVDDRDALKSIDFNKIFQLVEKGVIGKLVEITSPDGDLIEVVVE